MKKRLLLLMAVVLLGAAKMSRAEVINVVDYAGYIGPNGGISFGDYYIGKIHLNNLSQELWFEPVITREKVGSNKVVQLWQKLDVNRPRLYVANESKTINARLNEFIKNGLYIEDKNGRRIVVSIGDSNFPQVLKHSIAIRWGIVAPEVGEKYFKNGWSEGRYKELSENREYYNFEYPFQKMTEKEYNEHHIKVIGIRK